MFTKLEEKVIGGIIEQFGRTRILQFVIYLSYSNHTTFFLDRVTLGQYRFELLQELILVFIAMMSPSITHYVVEEYYFG